MQRVPAAGHRAMRCGELLIVVCRSARLCRMSVSEKPEVPPPDVQLRIVDAAALLQSVAVRRAAWLEASQRRAGEPTRAEVAAFVDVGDGLDARLADVEQHGDTLRRYFDEYPDWINERLAATLASGRFGDAELAAFARVVQAEGGDYASRGVALAAAAVEGVADARRRLRYRISGLPDGLVLAFDGHDTGCGLLAVAAMGGLAVCPKTGGVGCVIGAGSLIALVALC